jgi:hypothetical protein
VRAKPGFQRVAGVATTVVLMAGAGLLGGCADEPEIRGLSDEPTSTPTSDSGSASPSPTEAATPSEETSSPAAPGECSPPTSDVTYGAGRATLTIAGGEYAGTYELSTEPSKTDESVYQADFGGQFIGNWRGTLDEELPALEVRVLAQGGSACDGTPIVRIYPPFLAYTDEDSTACQVTLDTLTATNVAGSFTCTGIPRSFGTKEPATLDASGTFSLGS